MEPQPHCSTSEPKGSIPKSSEHLRKILSSVDEFRSYIATMEKPNNVYVPKSTIEEGKALTSLLKYEQCCVYVGNLEKTLCWEDVYKKLEQHGNIRHLIYPCGADGSGMGYAVVAYAFDTDAVIAARHLNGSLAWDKCLYAATTSTIGYICRTVVKLYISDFSDFINEYILHDVFGMKDTLWHVDIQSSEFGYRYAHVTFQSESPLKELLAQYKCIDLGDGFNMQLKLASDGDNSRPTSPAHFRKLQTMRRKGSYVLISGLPKTLTESQVLYLFRRIRNVKEVIILRAFGHSIGYAVMEFNTKVDAELAVHNHNHDVQISNPDLMMELVNVVSKPLGLPPTIEGIINISDD